MKKTAILLISDPALPLAVRIAQELGDAEIYAGNALEGCTVIPSFSRFVAMHFNALERLVFIGAMGICIRCIAPCVRDKKTDPAVVCIDSTGHYVIPVLSGHIGGANELACRLAAALGAEAVVTTRSDCLEMWALDTLPATYHWRMTAGRKQLNRFMALFLNGHPTALLLDIRDRGTAYLERTAPAHVHVFYRYEEIDFSQFELFMAVTPRLYNPGIPSLYYYPPVLYVGVGCRRQCVPDGIPEYITEYMSRCGLSPDAVAGICTIELKQDEPLIASMTHCWPHAALEVWTADELKDVDVPHPSEKAFQATGVYGVAEGAALKSSHDGMLLIDKQKGKLSDGNDFTFAVAQDRRSMRCGHIEIVGAGPGDPDLISVRGRHLLEQADLILYAGSLVPRELTTCAKPGAVVRSSADMDLEEQFGLMKSFYDKGLYVVRLHTGDPCIYGAIQEQMAFFDRYGMQYHITPGISSFQAAAAALRSQFTIPEKVQTIILTRSGGKTPMPEREQLHELAKSNSTMCIFLSANVIEYVQEELLQAYPPETPAAVCYKLTWKEEQIFRGQLRDLVRLVRDHHLTLTTLIVVGEAVGNREGRSKLYAHDFKHLFRP